MFKNWKDLNQTIVKCTKCPRLVAFRETVPLRRSLCSQEAWRKPIPGFGDVNGWLLILGLAPSSVGANRTGRIFTGDESARFLMKVLYQAGFANQSTSETADDGLELKNCYMTPVVKCVPPKHLPLPEEFQNCSLYLENEIFLLKQLRVVLALGKMAFDAYQHFLIRQGVIKKKTPFSHGLEVNFPGWPKLVGAYHPSPQNTYTGKLTEDMLLDVLTKLK